MANLFVIGCKRSKGSEASTPQNAVATESSVTEEGALLPPGLEKTAWKLLVIRDGDALVEALADSPAQIDLDNGKFNASTGCGMVAGTYAVSGNKITFNVEMTTMMADCSEQQMQQGLAFEEVLNAATKFYLDNANLTLVLENSSTATLERLQKID